MKKLSIVSSLSIALLGIPLSAEAKPERTNVIYTQSYTYSFKETENVVKCITRASAALARNGLGHNVGTTINDDEQYGAVWGWNSNRTETAEISCNRRKELSILGYAHFGDKKEHSTTFKRWKVLRDSRW